MNKHEQARKNIGLFSTLFDENNDEMNVAFDELEEYIDSCEATEKAHKLTVQLLDKANQIIDEKEKELEGLKNAINQFVKVARQGSTFEYVHCLQELDKLSKIGEKK